MGHVGVDERRKWLPAVVAGLAVALLTTACGGGDGDEGATSGQGTQQTPPPTTAATKSDSTAIAGASIRLVNAFAPDGKGEPITAYPGREAKPGDRPVVTVAFGEASQFFEPPAVNGRSLFSIYRGTAAPTPETRMRPVEETFLEGDRATLLVTALKNSEGRLTAGGQTFFEKGQPNSRPLTSPVAGKALIFANATALEKAGYNVGRPGSGCLRPATSALLGGTSVLEFQVDPGPIELAAYPTQDSRCTGQPSIVAVPISAQAGSRHLVLAVPAPSGAQFLVLPVSN